MEKKNVSILGSCVSREMLNKTTKLYLKTLRKKRS